MSQKKIILSLFDYSGNWPKYYKENGYDVYQIDLKFGIDILELTREDFSFDSVHGILAAPPCTDFAGSGAQWWKAKDEDGRTEESLKLIDKTIEIINWFTPEWWALENPVGRLQKLRPQLGQPWYFQPFWYGDPYTKKSGLCGKFNKNLPRNEVEPTEGSKMWLKYGGKSERTKELRSITPLGFAKAFYLANP